MIQGLRLLVCGGREYADRDTLYAELDAEAAEHGPVGLLIEGEARGADSLAKRWAYDRGIPVAPFAADWEAYGKRAGPIRNRKMLKEGQPDRVVAFPGGSLSESRGTADMVKVATEAAVPVRVVPAGG